MEVLNMDEEIREGIFSLVAAVLYVGNLRFEDVDGESVRLTKNDEAVIQTIGKLLQVCNVARAIGVVFIGCPTKTIFSLAVSRISFWPNGAFFFFGTRSSHFRLLSWPPD